MLSVSSPADHASKMQKGQRGGDSIAELCRRS
jgi:hypothetical protein